VTELRIGLRQEVGLHALIERRQSAPPSVDRRCRRSTSNRYSSAADCADRSAPSAACRRRASDPDRRRTIPCCRGWSLKPSTPHHVDRRVVGAEEPLRRRARVPDAGLRREPGRQPERVIDAAPAVRLERGGACRSFQVRPRSVERNTVGPGGRCAPRRAASLGSRGSSIAWCTMLTEESAGRRASTRAALRPSRGPTALARSRRAA
jgi:hypothetical protein